MKNLSKDINYYIWNKWTWMHSKKYNVIHRMTPIPLYKPEINLDYEE